MLLECDSINNNATINKNKILNSDSKQKFEKFIIRIRSKSEKVRITQPYFLNQKKNQKALQITDFVAHVQPRSW